MRTVQRFQIVVKAKPDFQGPLGVTVDEKSLSETIENYFLETTRKPWPEKSRAYLAEQPLLLSGTGDGDYSILLCANCAHSGFDSCADLGLKPIHVTLAVKTVTWTIEFADWTEGAPKEPLVLLFDRVEYQRELAKLQTR